MTTHLQPKPHGTPTWIDLETPDAEQSRAFYQAVFGWEYDIGGPEFGNYTTARLGTHTTAGIFNSQPNALDVPAVWNLYFASDDVNADVERALQAGAQILAPAMDVGSFGSTAVGMDPTGAPFSVWQAGSHVGFTVTDEPGSATWFELYSPNALVARDFYTTMLYATAEPMMGGIEYYVLKHGESMLAGVMQIDPTWAGLKPQWVVYFAVENIETTVAVVLEHGGKIMGAIDDSPYGRIAALQDPHGATFKVVQLAAR